MNITQTKPARSLGADITQSTLQQTLDQLNIDRQVTQMSYVEKRLLIMISLTKQLSGVTNDWGRTLESPSNQVRIMNEQWERLTRNVGNLFLATVSKILPYLNAVLMVLTEIVKSISSLLGYKISDFDFFDEASLGVENFADDLDEATESAKKLKQGLRGFDKLNVITTPSDSGSSAGSGVGSVDPKLLQAFNDVFDEYNKKLTDVRMKATEIRDKIMEWLGFEKRINEETGEVYFKFKKITGGTILGLLIVGGAIYKGIKTIFNIFNRIGLIKFKNLNIFQELIKNNTIKTLTTTFSKFSKTLGLTNLETGLLIGSLILIGKTVFDLYKNNEDFRKSIDNARKSVKTMSSTIIEVLQPVFDTISNITLPLFEFQWNQTWTNVETIVNMMKKGIEGSFKTIADVIDGVSKFVVDLVNGDFSKAFDDLDEMVNNIKKNWKKYWDGIVKDFEDWKVKTKEKIDSFVKTFKEKIDEIPSKLDELPEKAGKAVGKFIKTMDDKVKEHGWSSLGEFILMKITIPLITFPIWFPFKLMNFVMQLGSKIGEKMSEWNWASIGGFILDAIIKGMTFNLPAKLGEWAYKFVKGLKESLDIHSPSKLILDAKIGDFSMEAITLGMERQLPQLKEQAENIVDTLQSGMKEATIESNFSYDIPSFNMNSIGLDSATLQNNTVNGKTSFNPTFIVQVGSKEVAKEVLTELQDMAKDNGKPIKIGG